MQQPEFERTPSAFEAERSARGLAAPERFINDEPITVKAPQALNPALGQVREKRLVERPRASATARRPGRPADHIVLHVRGERREDAIDIVVFLEAEMLIELPVHF